MNRYTFDGQPATIWRGSKRDRADAKARRICWMFLLIIACAVAWRLA